MKRALITAGAVLVFAATGSIAWGAGSSNTPTPMLFDPMQDANAVDSQPKSHDSAPALVDAPSVPPQAPTSPPPSPAVGAESGSVANLSVQPVHPSATPLDSERMLTQAPQVAPAQLPVQTGPALRPRAAGGARPVQFSAAPPKIATAAQPVAPPGAPPPAAGFSIDVVAPESISVQAGVDTIIPIAKGHLNRITTPFPHPEVKTVSRATVQSSDNVLYVATNDDTPIALYIREKGHEDTSLDLTLIPRAIPPRELRIVVPENTLRQIRVDASPATPSTESSYVARIRDELRATAQGRIPSGFSLRQPLATDPGVFCMDPTLRIATGQVLEGHDQLILVAQVQNISNMNVEIDETACHQPGVLAIAAWPTPFVKPGAKIELFEVRKRPQEIIPDRERPSLIAPQ